MNKNHSLLIKPNPQDYTQGHFPFKAVTQGDWTPHLWFIENQRNPNFDDDGCTCYAFQKSLDIQLDVLLADNPTLLQAVTELGFMDTGTDGLLHFHSSPRFLENMTGNGINGNTMPDVCNAFRKYGNIPWQDMPFTPAMTQAEYFTPPTADQLAKGAKLLTLLGGKNSCTYEWSNTDRSSMQTSMLQAPLLLGIAVNDGWNQQIPTDPPATQAPQHAVCAYNMVFPTIDISDNYIPYAKVLDATYPIPYAMTMMVNYLTPVETVAVNEASLITDQIATMPASPQKSLFLSLILKVVESISNLFN